MKKFIIEFKNIINTETGFVLTELIGQEPQYSDFCNGDDEDNTAYEVAHWQYERERKNKMVLLTDRCHYNTWNLLREVEGGIDQSYIKIKQLSDGTLYAVPTKKAIEVSKTVKPANAIA